MTGITLVLIKISQPAVVGMNSATGLFASRSFVRSTADISYSPYHRACVWPVSAACASGCFAVVPRLLRRTAVRRLSALRVGQSANGAALATNDRSCVLRPLVRRAAASPLTALHVAAGLVSIPYLPSSLYFRMMRRCRLRLSIQRSRSAFF